MHWKNGDSRFSRLLTGHAEATHDWAARFDIVENIIARRLASAPPPPAGLLRSWRILQQSPNDVDLARLPEEFGCGRRHLIAQFHKYFGMAPKMITRISRFHLAVAAVHAWGGEILYRTWTENRISIARRTTAFAPPHKRGCGGRIWTQLRLLRPVPFLGTESRRNSCSGRATSRQPPSMVVKFFQYSSPVCVR